MKTVWESHWESLIGSFVLLGVPISVGLLPNPLRLRCTVISPHSDECTVITVDKKSAHLYQRGKEPVVVELIVEKFDQHWDQENVALPAQQIDVRFRG